MFRHIAAIALMLMLLTGLVLGQMTTLGSQMRAVGPDSTRSTDLTVRAFYAAINHYLDSGDPIDVERLLAPDFINQPTLVSPEDSTDDLIRYFGALRSTFPGLQLKVESTIVQGDSAAVEVVLAGDTRGTFAGLAIDPKLQPNDYEFLRLQGGQIAERKGSSRLPPLYETVAELGIVPVPGAVASTQIERQSFEAGASTDLSDPDGFILLMETGALSLLIEEETGTVQLFKNRSPGTHETEPVEPGIAVRIEAGQAVSIPGHALGRIWNGGQDRATALIFAVHHIFPFDYLGERIFVTPELTGVEHTLLAYSTTYQDDTRPSTLSVGWATVPPGQELPRHIVDGTELVLTVEGPIEATAINGIAGWTRPTYGLGIVEGEQILESGEGFSSESGAEVEYRAAGSTPAILLFVNVQPA